MNYRKRISRRESECVNSMLDSVESIMSMCHVYDIGKNNRMTMTADEIAKVMNTDKKSVLLYASEKQDPLPLKVIIGKRTKGFAFTDELMEWMKRNTTLWAERKCYKHDVPRKGGKIK